MLSKLTAPLTASQARHLLNRLTFGATRPLIDDLTGQTPEQAVATMLLIPEEHPDPPIDPKTGESWVNPKPQPTINSENGVLTKHFLGWWMDLMRAEGTSVVERMVYFLHTHFTTATQVVMDPAALYYQNKLFRHYALGNFKTLTKKVCVDNAMLLYLDGRLNEVGRPNENFARELLELYTIGKGPQIGPTIILFTQRTILGKQHVS